MFEHLKFSNILNFCLSIFYPALTVSFVQTFYELSCTHVHILQANMVNDKSNKHDMKQTFLEARNDNEIFEQKKYSYLFLVYRMVHYANCGL